MRDLDIKITVDHLIAKRNLAEVDEGVNKVAKSAETAGGPSGGLGKFETSLGKIGAALGGMAALDKAADNIMRMSTQSVKAFSEQEAALKKLEVALAAQGVAVPATMELYANLATQFQATTVNSDDLITEMQALLVQVGGVMPDQMGAALDAATKLSAGLDIDLRTATMAVAKAFDGGGQALGRMLPSLKDLIKDGATTADVLDVINARFGDAAVSQMDTYAGKVEHLKNNWNEFQERVGAALVAVLDPLLSWFLELPNPIQMVAMGIAGLTAFLAPLATGVELIARLFGTSLLPLLTRALPAAFTGLRVFLGPVGWFTLAITAIYEIWMHWDTIGPMVKRLYDAVKMWLVDKFKAVVDTVKGYINSVTSTFKDMYDKVVGNSFVPDMVEGISREFDRLPQVMVNPTAAATEAVKGHFEGVLSFLSGPFSGGWTSIFTDLFHGARGLTSIVQRGLQAFGDLIFPGFGGILAGLAPILVAGLAKLGGLFADFFRSIWDGIKGIGDALGNALGIGGPPAAPPPPGYPTYPSDPGNPGTTDPVTGIDYPSIPSFAMGGVMPSTGMAMLHSGEGVLNPTAMSRLGKSGLDAMNRGGSAAGAITVNVNVTGGVIDDAKTQRQLAAIVTRSIDRDYRLRRKVSAR